MNILNDPVQKLIEIINENCPNNKFGIIFNNGYVSNLQDETDTKRYLAWSQNWVEDDGTPSARIVLSSYIPYQDIVGILIHAFGHILDCWQSDHGKNFIRVVTVLWKEYMKWANTLPDDIVVKPDLERILKPIYNITYMGI